MSILTQSISLARDVYEGKSRQNGEPVINHCKRLADKALLYNYDETLIASCYLYEALSSNYEIYYDIAEQIKDIDESLFKIVDKITKKHTESWLEYYYRVRVVPEAKKIVLLNMLDTLLELDHEKKLLILGQLPKFL